MFRRRKRTQADELRAKFLTNREQVRSWLTDWECPEIDWPEFPEIPTTWVVLPGDEQHWLKHRAPFMDQYGWHLNANPVAEGIAKVSARWWFGRQHTFESLEIEFRSVADPGYLAEALTLGVHAAALKGWRAGDVHALHAWLFEGLDRRPLSNAVTGRKRTGFILFELSRFPFGIGFVTTLRMTLTDTALDGSPLDAEGRDMR